MEYEPYCDSWALVGKEADDECFSADTFYIHMEYTLLHPTREIREEDAEEESDTDDLESETFSHTWDVNPVSLTHLSVEEKLVELGIPPGDYIIHNILTRARDMTSNNSCGNHMQVRLETVVDAPPPTEDVDDLGMEEAEVRFVPASKLSIQRLEVSDVRNRKECVICLEDMVVGSKATRLPCSHTFHASCILSWLNTSSLCPLCRANPDSNT